MATKETALIPFSKIERIQNYINTDLRRSMADIMLETGADYGINGILFNRKTGEVVCHLKADGKVVYAPDYNTQGYAWDGPDSFRMDLLPNVPLSGDVGRSNYLACDQLIPTLNPYIGADRKGKRGRSAIGIKGDGIYLYCSKDGSCAARKPEQLRNDLIAAGLDSAIMLDGGGSSQCDFLGRKIKSSREVGHVVLIYLKNCPYQEPTKTVKRGSCGEGARWTQWMLKKWRPGLAVDGIFGKDSTAALLEFQKAVFPNEKDWDGKCGPKTRKELKKMGG